MGRPDGDDRERPARSTEVSRRDLLKLAGGGAAGAGAARVAYELIGFGTVTGTNLLEQRLGPLARRWLAPAPFDLPLADRRLRFDGDALRVSTGSGDPGATVPVADTDPAAAASAGAAHGLGGPCRELAVDLAAVESGDVTFEFSGYEAFFDRVRDANTRPFTVAALRRNRFRRPAPETVRAFAGVAPADPAALVTGLAEGFADRTRFDAERYVAGTVEDHLLGGAVDLRQHVTGPRTFEAILDGASRLYCTEYAQRAIEAFHLVAPHRQSTPVFCGTVVDHRHTHVYTALASVVREDGNLRVPMTFVDYSHSTMYDTYRVQWALGEGIDAYGERHRASEIRYRNLYV